MPVACVTCTCTVGIVVAAVVVPVECTYVLYVVSFRSCSAVPLYRSVYSPILSLPVGVTI